MQGQIEIVFLRFLTFKPILELHLLNNELIQIEAGKNNKMDSKS